MYIARRFTNVLSKLRQKMAYALLAGLLLGGGVLVALPASPANAATSKIIWPVDTTNGPWKITNGYDSGDHGCGGSSVACSNGYQLYGLDIARSDNTDLTAGTPIVSPATGRIAYEWDAFSHGQCVIIAVDGYPLSAVDSKSVRRVSICHVNINSQARVGTPVQQGVTQIGTITSWPGNQHLHFSLYNLDQYQSDTGANSKYRTPIAFNGDMQIDGCGAYNPNGTLNWAAKTYTGSSQFTGAAINCPVPPGPGKPGGWWLGPTPSDGTSALNNALAMPISAHGQDYTGSGLKRIDLTWQTEGSSQWSKQSKSFSTSPTTFGSDFSYNIPAPVGGWPASIIVSFDVFTNDGQSKLAPQGLRRICRSDVVCTPVTTNPPGGGGPTCTTPPSTTSDVSGATAGNQGWWRSSATLTLTATAPCGQSGLQTFYTVNGGSPNTYSGPVAFNQEGIYQITFYSVDALGNTESSNTAQIKIDWTPPATAGSATGPRDTNGIFRDNVTVGLAATDNLSGVDYEGYSLNGGGTWTTVSGANNSFILNGNGVSRAQYYSVDIAGNTEQPPKDSGPIIINKYVVFSNGTGQSLRFLLNGNTQITGGIHSNGTTNIDWNTGSSFGTTFRTVGTANNFGMYNTNTQVPTIQTGVPTVQMLAYPLSLYQSLATVVFPSDLKMDSVGSTLNSIIYVNGNVDMYNVNLNGPLSIVATGTINDNTTVSSYQTNDPNNGVLLYAGQNINVYSTGNRNLGLLYAPSGTVKLVNTTNLTLNGSLVGDQVELNSAQGVRISYSPAFSSNTYNLPLTAMGLVKPAGTPPPLPAVPSLLSPANGASVNKSAINVLWNAATGAFGYQVQISKSSSFATLEYNVSQLSTAQRVSLGSSATTYYWRVRAINQAGMSTWSPVGSFRTQ